jgi:hypothetical protein
VLPAERVLKPLAGGSHVYGGALAVTAGIAAFIEAHSNQPVAAHTPLPESPLQHLQLERALGYVFPIGGSGTPASGLSPTAYDLLRIGAWALVILGALTVILGLIRYWTAAKAATSAYGPERR